MPDFFCTFRNWFWSEITSGMKAPKRPIYGVFIHLYPDKTHKIPDSQLL